MFPVPHLFPHLYPWCWDRWKGLLACVMLDALLHAGPVFPPDCLIPESANCPYLTSVLPRCSGAVERSWWLTLDFGGAIVHSIPRQGIGAAQLFASCKPDFFPLATSRVHLVSAAIRIASPFRCNKCLRSNFPASPGSWESGNKLS